MKYNLVQAEDLRFRLVKMIEYRRKQSVTFNRQSNLSQFLEEEEDDEGQAMRATEKKDEDIFTMIKSPEYLKQKLVKSGPNLSRSE